jgi:hypothetical protein
MNREPSNEQVAAAWALVLFCLVAAVYLGQVLR